MGRRVRTRHLGIVLWAVLQSLVANPSGAAEWSMVPSVDLMTEFDDNIHLTASPHPSVWGIRLAPDIKFSGTTETLDVTGGLRFDLNRYFGESGLDTTDHTLIMRSIYKTERDVLGLNID